MSGESAWIKTRMGYLENQIEKLNRELKHRKREMEIMESLLRKVE